MERQILPPQTNNNLSADHLQFTIERPIKAIYDGIMKPIFTIPSSSYRLNATRTYASLRVILGQHAFWDMLGELDRNIPRVAWEQRHKWFPEDLHENTLEEFQEAYRRNLTDPAKSPKNADGEPEVTFSLYLGELRDGNKLPVQTFRTANTKGEPLPGGPEPLADALQELAWRSTQGKVSLLVECDGLWTREESFGLSWRVRQIVYAAVPHLPKGSISFTDNAGIRAHDWKIAPPPNALTETQEEPDGIPQGVEEEGGTTASSTGSDPSGHHNPLLDHDD